MARKSVFGNCHICGENKKLSFEHVPPSSAFNDCPAVSKHIFELINKNPDSYFEKKGKISQRGIGAYTLCEKCNNDTGTWYGDAFVRWAHQGMDILKLTQGSPSLYYTFHIFPLRVIKQIICMFFSITDDQFGYNHPDLVKFVLNKNECYFYPEIRILAYFNNSKRGRYIGGASGTRIRPDEISLNTLENLNRKADSALEKSRLLSELACRPLGYVMTFDPEPPDDQLVDISFFAKYPYADWTSISLQLPVFPVYTYFPGDYRSRNQVQHDAKANR